MTVTYLNARSHKILEAVILAYAESAAPVGSQFLVRRYEFGVSSATIRNVMAYLEAQGLITHPHTSSGRVPTDLGYRYYVDLLMDRSGLRPDEELALAQLEKASFSQTQDLLEQAARVLTYLTGQTAVILVPDLAQGAYHHLQLISVNPYELIGVLISSEGMVTHRVITVDEPFAVEELERLQRFLNHELAGMPLHRVPAYLEHRALQEDDDFYYLYQRAQTLLGLRPFIERKTQLILEGSYRLFEAPEFQDNESVRDLIQALESQDELIQILRKDLAADEVKLHIGSENRGTALTRCTIAAAPYRMRGGLMGALGIVGPTRMHYPKVATVVGRVAQAVTRAFQE